ncbi:MAG: hypothetical protein Phog2KO_26600 [Phototrophicaceae bacterium]
MPYSAMELAEVFLRTGELTDALDALNEQLSEYPDDDYARRLRIQTNMRLLDRSSLKSALNDLTQLTEKIATDYQTQSIIYQKMGNSDKALKIMQTAHDIDPQDERITEGLIDLLVGAEQYELALEIIREQEKNWRWLEREGDILILIGNDILAIARYGLVLAHLSELDGIMNENYLQALKLRVMLARAHAYRRLDYTDLARELYETAQTIIGEDATITFNLGLLAEIDGQHRQAISNCRKALANASPILQQTMLASITDKPKFAKLKQALNI